MTRPWATEQFSAPSVDGDATAAVDSDLTAGPDGGTANDPQSMQIAGGRMVGVGFMKIALRRSRRLWLGLAVLGLLIGVGYHMAVPLKYRATSTVYLADPPGSDATVAAANDLAMLQTAGVGQRALALLGVHNVTPSTLLGKAPGVATSDDVLTITISGSTPEQAVRRVNAVTTAYLAFRAEQYNAQNQSIVTAANKQIAKFETQIDSLTSQINALGTQANSQQLTALVAERSAATAQVTSLRQSVQQDNLNTLSVSQGSRVIGTGTASSTSKAKTLALDGLTGLVAGLAIGLIIVVLRAMLTDRLRRREDIAAVIGAPVDLSIGRVGRRRFLRPSSVLAMAVTPDPRLQRLAGYLEDRLRASGSKLTELVVAADDVDVPAAALAVLAGTLTTMGTRVVLVDATAARVLVRALGASQGDPEKVRVGASPTITLIAAPQPWEPDENSRWERVLGELAEADAVLIMATVDPAVGAWHLRTWASDAVITVSAGRSTTEQIHTITELLDAADVTVSSSVLLNADPHDESIGMPAPGASAFGRRLGLVQAATALPAS